MIVEKVDPRTGTILFVEDEESQKIRELITKVENLEYRIQQLESTIKGTH